MPSTVLGGRVLPTSYFESLALPLSSLVFPPALSLWMDAGRTCSGGDNRFAHAVLPSGNASQLPFLPSLLAPYSSVKTCWSILRMEVLLMEKPRLGSESGIVGVMVFQ